MLYNAVKISNIFKLLVELPFRDIRLNFFDFSYRVGQPRVPCILICVSYSKSSMLYYYTSSIVYPILVNIYCIKLLTPHLSFW